MPARRRTTHHRTKGEFPVELCELDALKELVLHTNRLSGGFGGVRGAMPPDECLLGLGNPVFRRFGYSTRVGP